MVKSFFKLYYLPSPASRPFPMFVYAADVETAMQRAVGRLSEGQQLMQRAAEYSQDEVQFHTPQGRSLLEVLCRADLEEYVADLRAAQKDRPKESVEPKQTRRHRQAETYLKELQAANA